MIAEQRCQIREATNPHVDSGLRQHIAKDDGLPMCGQPVNPWHGKEMQPVSTGRGEITCGRFGCGR
jgi:hypothetical protein